MLVTLWRHGEAGHAASDAERALTERGEAHVRSSAAAYLSWCRNAHVQVPSHCLHSPLVRTRQTSQLLAGDIRFASLSSDDRLAPGEQNYTQGLFLVDDADHQLIVGHQPYLSELINVWCDTAQYHVLSPSGFAVIRLLMPTCGGGELIHYMPEGFLP